MFAIGYTCASFEAIPAGTRSREVCNALAQWIARGIDLEDIARDPGRLLDYTGEINGDCNRGDIPESELCEVISRVNPFLRYPAPKRPFYPPGPPAPNTTVRVATNCTVLEVTPKERGVTTEPEDCAAQVLGNAVEQPAPPPPPATTIPVIPDFCPAPSVRISAPPNGRAGEVVVNIDLKFVGLEGSGREEIAPRVLKQSVENIFNKSFGGGLSMGVNVNINSTSPDATTFEFLSHDEWVSVLNRGGDYRKNLNWIRVGPPTNFNSLSTLAAHEIGHALGLEDRYVVLGGEKRALPTYEDELMAIHELGNFTLNELKRVIAVARDVENGECEN